MEPKFQLVSGKSYQVYNTKFTNEIGMLNNKPTLEFIRSFPCFDARFHGAGDPADYICYEFLLPEKFGTVSFFQFQIVNVIDIDKDLLTDMRSAYKQGKLKPLTFDAVKKLQGKHIQTLYFGYAGQDGVDDFIIGNLITDYAIAKSTPCVGYTNLAEYREKVLTPEQLERSKNKFLLLTDTGRNTYIFGYPDYDKDLFCSDLDRIVMYRIVE